MVHPISFKTNLCKVASLSIHKKQFCTTFPAQGLSKKARAPGFVSFVTALACYFCLVLTQSGAHLLAEPCISQGILTKGVPALSDATTRASTQRAAAATPRTGRHT